MRVPDLITASAVYLCVRDRNGSVIPAGTGFFVRVESETRPPDGHSYLVTARHCVENASYYGGLYARVNNMRGEAELVELQGRWFYHDDESNDVAVMPFVSPFFYRIVVVERDSIATPEVISREAIGIGDDLIVVGLFSSHYGRAANLPIVRQGIIAAMPHEPIQDRDSGLYFDAFLAEIRSIGGLSGSPVWMMISPARYVTGKPERRVHFYLLGLIRGHWHKREQEQWLSDFGETEGESLNTGIAMVTPIQKALDIIDSEDLVHQRRLEDRSREERSHQVLDSTVDHERR